MDWKILLDITIDFIFIIIYPLFIIVLFRMNAGLILIILNIIIFIGIFGMTIRTYYFREQLISSLKEYIQVEKKTIF